VLHPLLPDIRCVSYRRLFCIPDNRSLKHTLIFQNLLFPLLLRDILDYRQRVLILAILIEQCAHAANRLAYAAEFPSADLLFAHVNKLELNAALLEVTLRLFRIVALFRAEYLYVHRLVSTPLAGVRYLFLILRHIPVRIKLIQISLCPLRHLPQCIEHVVVVSGSHTNRHAS